MAKYLWPFGIHVSLIIVDGVIDLPETRIRMADKPDSFFVWSFEVEARPFAEKW